LLDVVNGPLSIFVPGFGWLFGDAEDVGAPAHLDPYIRRIDASAMPQRNQVVEQISALANDVSGAMPDRLKRYFTGFLDDLLGGLAGARSEQSRGSRMSLRRYLGQRPIQAVQFTRLCALHLDAEVRLLQYRSARAMMTSWYSPASDIALARLTAPARNPDLRGRTFLWIENFQIGSFCSVGHYLPPMFISMPETHGIETSGGTRCPRHLDRIGSRLLQI
jgi:hypothetical protein